MKTTGLTDLKAHLSEYMHAVERGEGLLVTRHGRPVARIVPVERSSVTAPAREKRLEEMEKAGLIRRGTAEPLPKDFFDLPAADTGEASVVRAVLEEREGGW